MNIILRLSLIALMPIGVSCIMALVTWKTKFAKLKKPVQQILIGIVFGIVSLLGTVFGVKSTGGAIINVRDAAPICAGFIFGGWSGIIAGFIGGIYRYVGVYFDSTIFGAAGSYTQLACSLSTICAGLLAAVVRRVVFNNHHGKWYYGIGLGVLCESFHMLMVFFTHPNDIEAAYRVVKVCALPMILVNSIAIGIALIGVSLIYQEPLLSKKKPIKISALIQTGLLGSLTIVYAAIAIFTGYSLKSTSLTSTSELLKNSVDDVTKDVDEAIDRGILEVLYECQNDINEYLASSDSLTSNDINVYLNELATQYGITEYSLISNPYSIPGNSYVTPIIYTNNASILGFDMSSGTQSEEFNHYILDCQEEYYIQSFQTITKDSNKYMKYGGILVNNNYYNVAYLQIGYNENTYKSFLNDQIKYSCVNSRVGEDGYMIVASSNGFVLSTLNGIEIKKVTFIRRLTLNEMTEGSFNNDNVYYYAKALNGYYIIATIPVETAELDTNISLMTTQLTQLFFFLVMYTFIYALIKKTIVGTIEHIDITLKEITAGNLNVSVHENKTYEFKELSENINQTVSTLEGLIEAEANRMNEELEFAKTIQTSSLPTNFKLDGIDNVDLYATMRTAKEVGGDFYDFYKIDDDRIAILIADVSGKGVPAALFMMKAKAIIKSLALTGIPVNEVFNKANTLLNEGNDANMFVTSWLGFVNVKTGVVEYVNGGHNPILVKHNDTYTYLRTKAGFILAVMDGMKYTMNTVTLEDNDSLYLYTDGVTEATDIDQKLYGEDRLEINLNMNKDKSSKELCESILDTITNFVRGAEQSDDITMLALKFKKKDA